MSRLDLLCQEAEQEAPKKAKDSTLGASMSAK